jgi:DNA-binding transcriptional ArsR family regulator
MSGNYENPLEIAAELGRSIAGELGERALIELELAYINSLLPRFANNKLIRNRQHILLHWAQSYYKSTILDVFDRCLPNELGKRNVTSNTAESLFGTINDQNKIVYPIFTDIKFAKISELSTFASGKDFKEIVNNMNKVLELEEVTRDLLKLGRRDISDEEIEKAADKGVIYDPILNQLCHYPDVTFFAGSRPLENRTYTFLRTSGFLYRFHIIQKEFTDKDVEEFLRRNNSPKESLCDVLKELNTKILRTKIKHIETPDDTVHDEIIDYLLEYAKDCISNTHSLKDLVDTRTSGDIIREIAAYATIRTLVDNGFKDVDSIEYNREDIDFIKDRIEHFIEPKVNPLFTESRSNQRKYVIQPIEKAMKAVLEFLKDGKERSRSEIDDFVLPKTGVSKATLSNALKKLLFEEGKLIHRHGFYRIK